MIKHITVLLLLLSSLWGYSQFDTTFVYINKKTFSVSSISEFYKTSYHIKYNRQGNSQISLPHNVKNNYYTQNSLYTGVGFSFKRLGFSILFRLPYTNTNKLKQAKSFAFSGGYSFSRLYGELNIKQFKGLIKETITHTNDNEEIISDIKSQLRTSHIQGTLYYFSSKKFNYDASFKNFHIQKKPAVSFSLGYGIGYHDIEGKMDVVKLSSDSVGQAEKRTQILSNKILPGISGVFVKNHFYLAANTFIGMSLNYNLIDNKDDRFSLYPNLIIKSALGYNKRDFSVALTFVYENDLIPLSYNDLSIRNYTVQLKIGYKISNHRLWKFQRFL